MSRLENNMTSTIWYTRCPVPTASGIAFQRGMFDQEFAGSGYAVRNIKELGRESWDSHFNHSQNDLFREGGGSPPIWARANGAKTRLLAVTFMNEALRIYVRADDSAQSIEDLAGRRCALPVWPKLIFDFYRFAAEKGFYSALKVHGMDDTDVNYVDVMEADDPHEIINPQALEGNQIPRRSYYHNQMLALCDSRVDAIFAKGGECAQLERESGGRIRQLYDVSESPNMADRVNNSTPRLLTVSESLLHNHPEATVSYVRMLVRAANWAQEHVEDVANVVAVEAGISSEDMGSCFESNYQQKFMPSLSQELLDAVSVMKTFLFDRGYLKHDFALEDWVAPEPIQEALALEGQV